MYTLLVLVCLQAVLMTASTLPSGFELQEPDTLEEPPHVSVMEIAKDGSSKQNFLTTRQKKVLFHPKIQEMIMDKLNRDMMDYEIEREEGNTGPQMLPPGFISPRALADWGIDWDDLASDGDYNSANDTERAIDSLHSEGKKTANQMSGRTDNNVWSLTYWHPAGLLADSEHESTEE